MNSQVQGTASILAIGTELTTGQITNRNAAWISEKLVSLGIEVLLHLTVADERTPIKDALESCSQVTQHLFVTGGLGPTTDDFTREVVADWLKQPLEFDALSWQRILERLGKFNIPVADSNRQQCYFPTGSVILPNPQGTAAGFTFRLDSKDGSNQDRQIWVLPGPPLEVAAIWQTLEPQLRKNLPVLEPLELLTWGCIGKSEAELGEITEKALAGSGLQTGYRAHRPYVEIKVWCPKKALADKAPWLKNLEEQIHPWVVTRQGEDLAETFLQKLGEKRGDHSSLEITDAATGGILMNRISSLLRESRYERLAKSIQVIVHWTQPTPPEEWTRQTLEKTQGNLLSLAVAGFTEGGQGCIGLKDEEQMRIKNFQSFYTHSELTDRRRHEMSEIALQQWIRWLS
jgi:molybdenum cofactor synthesis domain-containing protein